MQPETKLKSLQRAALVQRFGGKLVRVARWRSISPGKSSAQVAGGQRTAGMTGFRAIRRGRTPPGKFFRLGGFYGAAFTFTRIKRSAAVTGVKLSRTLSVVALLMSVVVLAALKAASSGLPAVSTT